MGRIYQALDRFLPFDRYLDPIFGGQPQTDPMGNALPMRRGAGMAPPMRQQAPSSMAPQGASQGGMDMNMGFPPMPPTRAPEASPTAPQRAVPRKVSLLRVLDGTFGGKTFSESLDAERARPAQEAAAAQRQQQIAAFAQTLPEHERGLFLIDPEEWVKKNADRFAPHDPSVVGNAMVAPTYGPQGWSANALYTAPEKPATTPPAPNGYRWRSDGMGLEYIPGGPADPRTVGARATAGRAPPRVGGGGRSATAPATSGGIRWD